MYHSVLRLYGLTDPSVSSYIAKTRSRYGKYSLPIEKVRGMVDKSMGETPIDRGLVSNG